MAKFSNTLTTTRAPIVAQSPSHTYNGALGYTHDAKGELFLLAATNMVSEDTFYESASKRDTRFSDLVAQVTREDPAWVRGFAPYLRSELKMRSASVVLACEYVKAGGPLGRQVVNAVCQRADEPAEVLAYWIGRYGRSLPMPIKRGVADAVRRLYTERNVLKWDSSRRSLSFADVIELTHPRPQKTVPTWQSSLFKYLLDNAHHSVGDTHETLPVLAQDSLLLKMPESDRRDYLRTAGLPDFWAWERLAGWLPGGMDAEAWEAVIPNMGVMALLRNLRNFDAKGVSEKAIDAVIAKVTDAEEIAKSRVFPYQVWSAYREAPSDNWKRALAKTLDLATGNTPDLGPGTLVLIDTSGSMEGTVSGKSTVSRIEVAAVMAVALAHKHADTTVAIFANTAAYMNRTQGASALSEVQDIVRAIGVVGHSTNINTSIAATFDPKKHQRVIVFTDGQSSDTASVSAHVPRIYTFDLAGYRATTQKNGSNGRFIFGGFSDATMTGIAALEAVGHTGWPFEG